MDKHVYICICLALTHTMYSATYLFLSTPPPGILVQKLNTGFLWVFPASSTNDRHYIKGVGKGAAVAALIILKKKLIKQNLKVFRNASAIASDHLGSMVRQSVAFGFVYTSATWGVPIHISHSVPGVRKQYTGFHNWTSHCFMYVLG